MSLVRYSPWGVGQLQNEINRIFSSFDDSDSSGATADWVPPVDIHEFNEKFQLFVDLPGVAPDAVEITLDNGVLTIRGQRETAVSGDDAQKIERRVERGQGRFHRRFILPDMVDADKVEAADRNGVLEITIPKQAKAQPRRITIAA